MFYCDLDPPHLLHLCLQACSFLPICSVFPTTTTGNNSVIMEGLQNWQQNYSCFRRKRIQVAYPMYMSFYPDSLDIRKALPPHTQLRLFLI